MLTLGTRENLKFDKAYEVSKSASNTSATDNSDVPPTADRNAFAIFHDVTYSLIFLLHQYYLPHLQIQHL
jgi:hypothetical protein